MVMQCNTYAVLYIIIVVFYFEISSNGVVINSYLLI